jgi:hypothetical protein
MWHDGNMPAKAVQISVDLELLRRIDADPETRVLRQPCATS